MPSHKNKNARQNVPLQASQKSIVLESAKDSRRISLLEDQIRAVFVKSASDIQIGDGKHKPSLVRRLFGDGDKKLKTEQIDTLKNELVECCLTHMQDSYRVHLSRLKGLQILETLIRRSAITKMNSEIVTHMVWACLSCIHHFLLRLTSDGGIMQWIRRKQARKSIKCYDKLLSFLAPTYYSVVFNAIVTFFEEANIWDTEYYCSNLLRRILDLSDEETRTDSILELMSLAENNTMTSALTSRQILQVLTDIQEGEKWRWINTRLLDRYLEMYFSSLTPEDNNDYSTESLEKSLETSLRSMSLVIGDKHLMFMINWMLQVLPCDNLLDEDLLNFGSLLEHITTVYRERADNRPLPEQVIPAILKLIASDNLLYSLLGNRVLHNLIDRYQNKLKFDTPRIFLRNSHYNIVLNTYNSTDKLLFQRYREILHKIFVESLVKHAVHKIHLENVYVSIVLFLVEIPCGYTAAAGICLAMSIQDAALNNQQMHMTQTHRLHATVVSIMSLICYIHKADVFYDYVETIIDRRANFAPHLNPPIRMKYKYAQHHVLWNKPDLFFEDWETRYGLWRCFRNRHKDIKVVHI